MKALLISLGTGVGPNGTQNIVHGLLFSIRSHNPDRVFLVTSKESQQTTLPELVKAIMKPYEVISLPDAEDVNKIYEYLLPKYREIRNKFEDITVDYTSGTKAITAALAILGSWHEADALSYVSGERREGTVVTGTERLLVLQPYQIMVEKRLSQAVSLFNSCQFDGSLVILAQVERSVPHPSLLEKLRPLRDISLAYSAWDKFDHQEALDKLRQTRLPEFDDNKAFLGKLCHAREKEPYCIADLINNAGRRGDIEKKYDDAVARLYRTVELIAQYKLKQYGITDTGDIAPDKVPPSLAQNMQGGPGKIQVGLEKAYQMLDAYGDDIGKSLAANSRLKNLLRRRNSSMLAHGLVTVDGETYRSLLEEVHHLASLVVEGLDRLLSQSQFRQWSSQ